VSSVARGGRRRVFGCFFWGLPRAAPSRAPWAAHAHPTHRVAVQKRGRRGGVNPELEGQGQRQSQRTRWRVRLRQRERSREGVGVGVLYSNRACARNGGGSSNCRSAGGRPERALARGKVCLGRSRSATYSRSSEKRQPVHSGRNWCVEIAEPDAVRCASRITRIPSLFHQADVPAGETLWGAGRHPHITGGVVATTPNSVGFAIGSVLLARRGVASVPGAATSTIQKSRSRTTFHRAGPRGRGARDPAAPHRARLRAGVAIDRAGPRPSGIIGDAWVFGSARRQNCSGRRKKCVTDVVTCYR
jgi:hypothetical protein